MMRTVHHCLGLAALLIAVAAAGAELAPDEIFCHGTVLTMDSRGRVAQAVAVRGGRIVSAGSDEEVGKLAGPQTNLVDLQGRTLLPGFYAAHDHFPSAGTVALYQVDLNSPPMGAMRSLDDILAALRAKAGRTPQGEWIVGRGYDDTLIREGRHPTRYDLDRVSTDHPIWIGHTSGHLGVANSRALAIAGVTKDTTVRSGVIGKDPATGEPNGVFEECCGLVSRHVPDLALQQRLEAIRWCDGHYLSKGVTTTVIAHGSRRSLDDLKEAQKQRWLHLRVASMVSSPDPAAKEALARGLPLDQIHLAAAKLLADGSIQGYTGHLTAPYYCQPPGKTGYCGYGTRTREELAETVKKLHRAGWQVAIHANGDAAIDDVLFAFGEAQRDLPRPDARHRIEHCQTVREDQLARMRELGITPSFFVGHVYYWGDRHREIFLGPERAARISPLRSALAQGLRVTLHNDTPVTPVDPLMLVWTAVNRLTRAGEVLGPEQRISVWQALRAVTIDAAWQNFEDQDKGSVEPGKLADFVLLAENPVTVEPRRLKDIAVLETIVGGETVYRKPAAHSGAGRAQAAEMARGSKRTIVLDVGGGVQMELVLIPPGSFFMGDDKGEDDEKPVHKVTITRPFYLGKDLVTQEQWQAVMGSGNPSSHKGPKNPVESIDWLTCQKFIEKLNTKPQTTSGRFRLPTEAEWEYACRAGSTTRYSFGDSEADLGQYAWFSGNSAEQSHPGGLKKPNAWGLYDMHGNLWQWCADWYGGDYYQISPGNDPGGPQSGRQRVQRGGSWLFGPEFCRSAARSIGRPTGSYTVVGLRVARTTQ